MTMTKAAMMAARDPARGPALYYDIMHTSSAGQTRAAPSAAVPAHAHDALDAWVREVVAWHFDPDTGSPFWLDFAARAGWDPRREVTRFEDLRRFGEFQDDWLRGGPVQRWIPKGLAGRPVFV